MDKNTVTGLILMALVFFAFMWLRPKNEPVATDSQTDNNKIENVAANDSLSANEREWLVKNIVTNGTDEVMSDGRHASRINERGVNLAVSGDSVFGTVEVDGTPYSWSELSNRREASIPAAIRAKGIEIVKEVSNTMGRYGRFSQFLVGEKKEVVLQNDVLKLTLNSKSGSVTRAELKKYDTEYSADETENVKKQVVLFDSVTNKMAFTLPLPQAVSTADLYFTPSQLNDSTVLMSLNLTPSAYWGIEYTLPKGDSYVVRMRIVQKGMQPIVQSNVRTMGIDWNQQIKRQEKGRMFEERNSGIFYKFAGGSVENLSENKNDKEERQAKVKWIGFKNQFFSSVLIARSNFNTSDFDSEILKGSDYLKNVTASAEVNDYDWNSENPVSFDYFLGPNLYPLLKKLEKNLQPEENLQLTRLIPLGWALFRWINVWVIIPVFDFLGSFLSNYGIIILLLTIFIKLILFPLTYKSYKSQAKMRILAPDIKAINDKYPGNENAMIRNQKTMELYSKAGASPMSGCLPMLLQMPILFAMFTFFPSCIELRGESFLWAHDLAAPDAIISWRGNIPLVTEYFGNHISLFCLLMTVVNILYTRINMQNSPGQMPGMKWMMYLMPIFFMVFFNNYAAGLSYYYFLSLLITIAQTYIFRLVIKEEDVRKTMAENAKKPRKKSGFAARLEEMQRQQQQMLKEQQKNNRRR